MSSDQSDIPWEPPPSALKIGSDQWWAEMAIATLKTEIGMLNELRQIRELLQERWG